MRHVVRVPRRAAQPRLVHGSGPVVGVAERAVRHPVPTARQEAEVVVTRVIRGPPAAVLHLARQPRARVLRASVADHASAPVAPAVDVHLVEPPVNAVAAHLERMRGVDVRRARVPVVAGRARVAAVVCRVRGPVEQDRGLRVAMERVDAAADVQGPRIAGQDAPAVVVPAQALVSVSAVARTPSPRPVSRLTSVPSEVGHNVSRVVPDRPRRLYDLSDLADLRFPAPSPTSLESRGHTGCLW